jgi:membrane protein
MLEGLITQIERWLFEPREPPRRRLTAAAVHELRYLYALVRDFMAGELTLRAMSLVYTTILSIVPLMALSFSVLKGLGYHRELEPFLYHFLQPIGERAQELTERIMQFVDNVRGGLLGSLGLVFLLYTVISMVQKVEESLNFIWRVEQPRSFARRFSEYLSVMFVGPALIVTALGLLATLASSEAVRTIAGIEPFGTVLLVLGRITPYVLVAIVFTFMYAFVPNTKVKIRAAAIGGLTAGIIWATTGALFTSFVANTTRNELIYAGFAIVILALIWVYLSWLILLIGAQLAFYVQNPQYLRPGRSAIHLPASLRERVALGIMFMIGHDYRGSEKRWTLNDFAEHFQLPSATLGPVVAALEARGLIVATETDAWIPGRDPDVIALADVLDAVRNEPAGLRLHGMRSLAPADAIAKAAEEALRESVRGKTLRNLVGE